MRIAAITMVYNEAVLLPYFLRHYEYLDEIYVLYEIDSTDDTLKILKQASNVIVKNCHAEGGLDDIDKVNLINNILHTIKADWVYVVDCDEFIFPPQESPASFLNRQDRENYNAVLAGMFQVYRHRTDKDLNPSLPPVPQRIHGDTDLFSTVIDTNKDANVNYIKPIVVKPSSEIRFQPGNHAVEGNIRISPEIYIGAHWQMADPSLAIDRRVKNKARMSERNKRLGMGYQHWDITEEWIRAECDRHLDNPLIKELDLFSKKSSKSYNLLIMRIANRAIAYEMERMKQRLQAKLESKDVRIHRLESRILRLQSQIQQIQQSIPMQLVNRYQKVINKLLPPNTHCRRPYELMLSSIRVILNKGWKGFFREVRAYLLSKRDRASKQQ